VARARTGHVGDGLILEDLELSLNEGLPVELLLAQDVDELLRLGRGHDQSEQVCNGDTHTHRERENTTQQRLEEQEVTAL
jgi:hypothetical protein